jgi:hypothetical protein
MLRRLPTQRGEPPGSDDLPHFTILDEKKYPVCSVTH